MKEKLLELLHNIPEEILGTAELADYLIKNGIVVCKHCEECDNYKPSTIREYYGWCSIWGSVVRGSGFCHHGERK